MHVTVNVKVDELFDILFNHVSTPMRGHLYNNQRLVRTHR